YPWDRLRKERNGIYEKAIDPPPVATDWFHARIEVSEKQIKVFVNGAKTPSLVVDKLNDRKDGMIGLWNEGENGEFANLTIKQ
ncbi:MAG TPA: family 16 glycoside hydrolase, partial [Cyclobacteriaceae bacterium]